MLRYGDFHTADDLVRTIEAFIRRWNRDHAKPFRWSYEGRPLVEPVRGLSKNDDAKPPGYGWRNCFLAIRSLRACTCGAGAIT